MEYLNKPMMTRYASIIIVYLLGAFICNAKFTTYSSTDNQYSGVTEIEYLLPYEITHYNDLKEDNPFLFQQTGLQKNGRRLTKTHLKNI